MEKLFQFGQHYKIVINYYSFLSHYQILNHKLLVQHKLPLNHYHYCWTPPHPLKNNSFWYCVFSRIWNNLHLTKYISYWVKSNISFVKDWTTFNIHPSSVPYFNNSIIHMRALIGVIPCFACRPLSLPPLIIYLGCNRG